MYSLLPAHIRLLVLLVAPAFGLSHLIGGTDISLKDGRWFINGRVTNPDSAAEGLLMNVRMVNATFEDLGRPDFDAEANTNAFLAHLSEYSASGVNAFTFCLQGGNPEYEGAINSAFAADGSLRTGYMRRIEQVIRACDDQGIAVILSYFYQRQIKRLENEAAIRAGVENATRWIVEHGFKHVLVEVANEHAHGGFKTAPVIQTASGQANLLRLVKHIAPHLLVTASGYSSGRVSTVVADACDFLSPHWNLAKLEDIPSRIEMLRRFGKPLVCNEALRQTDRELLAALRTSVAHGCSYGLMAKDINQTYPFRFLGIADSPAFYAALHELTSPQPKPIFERNGIVQFEAEDGIGDWRRISTPTGGAVQDPGAGAMAYEIEFTRPGRYYVFLLARQGDGGRGRGKENDVTLTLGGERLYGIDDTTRPEGIRCSGDWKWAWRPKGPGSHTPATIRDNPAYFRITQPGRLRLEMKHRSENFAADRILLKLDDPTPPQ
ncbi:MAG: hypothetical protein KBA71_08530 [Opitutaceae bacterium]|nr:hypothetical protein [Opitutaceae bacterium]